MLRVGFSVVDITPDPGLKMEGMLNPPAGEGVRWPLTGRTIVFDDGVHLAALVNLDLLFLMPATVAEFRQAVTAGNDLAPSDVMIACTHTHRAPYVTPLMDDDPIPGYVDFVRERLVRGMAAAVAARRPARLKVGRIDAPGWTFNRRQVYQSKVYGEQVGTQGPEWIDSYLRREGPEDNELLVMVAEGADGLVLGGLVNFACHTTVMGSLPYYSADFAGPLTEALEARHGGTFVYMQGAAGNLWSVDMSEPGHTFAGAEHAERMGRALADKAGQALESGQAVADGWVRIARRILRIPQRRATREQVELARWYLKADPQNVDQQEFTRRIYGHDYTFYHNSPDVQEWFAREMIGMWEWQRRAAMRELVEDVEVQVIAIGDMAIAGYPAEYFTEFGIRTKDQSPFAVTFVAELANGWHGYVPTQEAFAHGGYEPRLGYQSRLVEEAGDLMCDSALDLLAEVAPRALRAAGG